MATPAVVNRGNEGELPSKYPKEKCCGCCKQWMRVVINESFNLHRGQSDGLQPFCRRCDAEQKHEPEKRWPIFLRELERRKRGEERLWTSELYMQHLVDAQFLCRYCGGDVREWSGGYSIDKVDPTVGYVPSNCVVCCWPCNRTKSNRHEAVFLRDLRPLLEQYGRGKIPWSAQNPVFKRVEHPNVAPYVIPNRQPGLFDRGAA